ncbi:PTS sugar transporter subunit IIA [Liquorilactobacillus vini]|uniref:PTS sugar transporter subunit IIA n=1 Tax=Liquorilactobacillus vini TaxID=238015 RepID=UPI000299F059|nr:PTS sugar transporter subunit IIA [Liquorilactobacillus vini]
MKKIFLWEPSFESANKSDFINDVVNYLFKEKLICNREKIEDAINYREKLNNTIIDHNLAAPHIQNANVKQAILLFIKLRPGEYIKDWSENNIKVDRFIFTLIPEKCRLQDLQSLKNFYIHLSKENVIRLFCQGERTKIRDLLLREEDWL